MDKQDLIVKLLEAGNKANDDGHKQINSHLAQLNGQVALNTKHRISVSAIVGTLKWGIGLVGLSGVINVFHIISEIK